MLTEEKISAEELWREFGAMEQWVQNAQTQLSAVESAKIYKWVGHCDRQIENH